MTGRGRNDTDWITTKSAQRFRPGARMNANSQSFIENFLRLTGHSPMLWQTGCSVGSSKKRFHLRSICRLGSERPR